MPNIQQYDAPQGLGLQPTEMGIDANLQAARRGGAFFNQAAQAAETVGKMEGQMADSSIKAAGQVAVDYAQHQEISHGAAAYANLNDQLTQAWNETAKNADPNDPTVAQKFREGTLEPALQKYQEGFLTEGGQKFAEARIDSLRNHMFEKTTADMGTLAADAVSVNVKQTANSMSNTAMTDPSSVPHLLDGIDGTIGAMVDSSPNLKGAAAAHARMQLTESMRENIVKAGAIGAIQKAADPEAEAQKWGEKYPQYINGAELKMLGKAAEVQNKSNILVQKQTQLYQKQLDTMKVDKASNKAFSDNVTIDPTTGRPSVNPQFFKDSLSVARDHPDAPNAATTARTLLDWGEHQQNLRDQPTVSDPQVKQDLTDRLFDPSHPTTRVDLMKAQVAGKLSDHDFTTMERLTTELAQAPLKGPVWQDTMAAVKNDLIVSIPGVPGKDNVGTNNYASFAQSFIPQYLAKQRAGTLEPNALDVKDPNSMISKSMAPFMRTQAQRMSDYIATAGGITPSAAPAATRKVGDTPVPAALNGIAALQYNRAKGIWRDQTSGKVYDKSGAEVKQ